MKWLKALNINDTATPASNMCSVRLPNVLLANSCTKNTANRAPRNAEKGSAKVKEKSGNACSKPQRSAMELSNNNVAILAPNPAPDTTPNK